MDAAIKIVNNGYVKDTYLNNVLTNKVWNFLVKEFKEFITIKELNTPYRNIDYEWGELATEIQRLLIEILPKDIKDLIYYKYIGSDARYDTIQMELENITRNLIKRWKDYEKRKLS